MARPSRTLHLIYRALPTCLCSQPTTLAYALYSGLTINSAPLTNDSAFVWMAWHPATLAHQAHCPRVLPLRLPSPTHPHAHARWALPSDHLSHLKSNNYLCNYL